jgi:hypothetical protein
LVALDTARADAGKDEGQPDDPHGRHAGAFRQSGENEFGRFHVSLSPSSDNKGGRDSRHVDVEMQFTALEPPESVMRLIDEYTNKVIPRPKQRRLRNAKTTRTYR